MTDRELDALVAEHGFDFQRLGLKVCRTVEDLEAALGRKPEMWETPFLPVLADGLGTCAIMPYSSNLSAAWRLHAKMRERGWVMRLAEREDGTWGVEFIDTKRRLDIDGHHLAEADTAEKAIVIAALRALGASV
jgi:hypothetical protein